MKWTKDQVLTNAVCIFIKNKVNSLYPNLHVWLSSKHYMRQSVGGAKQAVMSKQALIYFSEGGACPHYYIIG